MDRLVEYEGDDRARAAYAQGKGVLFFTGHFGYLGDQRDRPCAPGRAVGGAGASARQPAACTSCSKTCGRRTGNTVIYRQGAIRRVLRVLQAKHGVAMLIDQHMHSPDAIYVNFFERPAATTSMLAALALRTGAPVLPVFALPLPGGRYRMIYERAVDPPDADTPGCRARVHAAVHRRARDVRAASSVALALDAPAMA